MTLTVTAKQQARATARVVGSVTHRCRMNPAFLIVGAQRCGTTSMYRALTEHPAVLPAVLHKGAHYFDTGYGRGPAWYRGHFPLLLTAGLAHRRVGVPAITGESSPYYMFHPLAAERIARDLPAVKLIVLIRDPVERAYSAHAHELARGFEAEQFERALELEPERLAGAEDRLRADPTAYSHSHQHHAYLARGRYAQQLERLCGLVGPERMHVVDSGRLFADPEPVYARLLDFLELPRLGDVPFAQHNARPRAPMADALRTRLAEHFRPHDERLVSWLGAAPSWRDQ